MKEIEFIAYGSTLHRDGLPTHVMLIGDVKAACGASGVSFKEFDRYKRNAGGSFFVVGSFGPRKSVNPITCKKCLEKISPVLDEYRKPISTEAGEYRYMGHWITDQREWKWKNLPPWVTIADTKDAGYEPHWSFSAAKAWCKANRINNPDTQVSDYI